MSRYFTVSLSATDEHVAITDRPYKDTRIVNLDIGPLSLMLSGKDEEQTEATLEKLHDALTTLLAASRARRVAELDVTSPDARRAATDAAVFVAGGATPSEAVEWALEQRPMVEHVTREPQA